MSWHYSEPDIQVVWRPWDLTVHIDSSNVSRLILKRLSKVVNDVFVGLAYQRNATTDQIMYCLHQALYGMIQHEEVEQNRRGMFEVCGWLEGSNPKDYYRHFLG
jgi:ribulose bisphosphate carboxylase small subunit